MNSPPRNRRPLREPAPHPEAKKKKFPWWALLISIVCVGVLGFVWVFADEQIGGYDSFDTMRNTVAGDVFHGPVSIDGLSLSGMTMDEARQALSQHADAQAESFEVTVTAGADHWRIASDNVPMEWDTETLLQQAWTIGRSGSLEQRYEQLQSLQEPVQLYSQFTYDKEAVRTLTNRIATELTTQPVNAEVVAFVAADRSFAYSEAQPGQGVDAEQLYRTVIDQLDNGRYGSVVEAEVTQIEPLITRSDLEANYKRLSSYTTDTTKDSNRNNNIELSAHALNGKMIAPGDTISFNETTGERTREKGYLEAGAIENGRTVQEVGGGVCQTSSTLFNALVRANCEIVKRKPHAWPSDYVPRGEDATVDWPNLDLVMRNATNAPMFIVAWYENQKVTVEVYGFSLGDGVSIELESETTYSKKPTEVTYTYNAKLPVGTTQLLKKPRTGYSVQTYKIWLENGVEVRREKLYTSEYRVINEEYEYNDGKPPA